MVILLKDNADPKQVENLIAWLKSMGFDVHVSVGARQTILGLIGDTSTVDIDRLGPTYTVDTLTDLQHAWPEEHPDEEAAWFFITGADALADVQHWRDPEGIIARAQLVGVSRRLLDLTVGYVAERRQFGVPIGSQQAVKHHLADAALQLQFAAPAVYRAAWSLSTGDANASRDVSMAKAMASDAARLVGRKALQVHGAIGYTVEYDLHLYFKRAEALARSWGDAAWHRSRVADALGI